MNFKIPASIFYLMFLITFDNFAEPKTDSYYYQNSVYNENIKSVQFFRENNELSNPIIELNGTVSLILKFDELSEDTKSYQYTIIHCDSEWNESFLRQNEYLKGFPDNPVNDYALSFNTTVKFVNYRLQIPNEDCNVTKSGNYALVVFENNNRENLVLIQRFFVFEPAVSIEALVKKATFDPYNGDNQEIDFKLFANSIKSLNPRDDFKVVLTQNRRWDSAIKGLKPTFIRDNVLTYDYNKENVFQGGNEFRYFDIRTKKYNGENVADIKFVRPYYHVTLLQDAIRSNKKYSPYREMNGNFVIQSQDRITDADTECDYFFVHFSLPLQSPLLGGSVNIFGALTGWNANKTNEMKWNFVTASYEKTLMLKQGYYNYQYVYVAEGSKTADTSNIEGTFYITENEYQIYVYYSDLAGKYERLVGYTTISTAK